MTRNATQDEIFDHDRDNRKNWSPPDDRDFPLRLEKPLTTAMDVVVLVKALPNYEDAVKLVETYAGMIAANAAADEALLRLQHAGGADV